MRKILRQIQRSRLRPNPAIFRRFATLSRDVPAPSLEEADRRLRDAPGFFASLSPEAWETIRSYDGPEVIGPADSKFRL